MAFSTFTMLCNHLLYWVLKHFFTQKQNKTKQKKQNKTPVSIKQLLPHYPHCFLSLFSSVQSLSCVQLFATPWIAARQASLAITSSRSLFKLMSIESVMPSNHLILCRPLLLPSSIFPSIRVFSKESVLRIMWPKYWSFSFSISPSNSHIHTWLLEKP